MNFVVRLYLNLASSCHTQGAVQGDGIRQWLLLVASLLCNTGQEVTQKIGTVLVDHRGRDNY